MSRKEEKTYLRKAGAKNPPYPLVRGSFPNWPSTLEIRNSEFPQKIFLLNSIVTRAKMQFPLDKGARGIYLK